MVKLLTSSGAEKISNFFGLYIFIWMSKVGDIRVAKFFFQKIKIKTDNLCNLQFYGR